MQPRPTPRQRLVRGLTYTVVGPVDVVWGTVGLGVHSARTGASAVRRRYRQGRVAPHLTAAHKTFAQELAAAREVMAGLPQALQEAQQSPRRRTHRWMVGVIAAVVAAAGGVAVVTIIRRPSRPEPSPRPPSVDVHPKP
ncbi:cell wall synthesis protein CwsA [Mycobacterium botniense]|uniref:Cell wall synthesis protein CwsA n=2 Tax=Mycobacterium botniense TaxID=84962 RepID=A0A7I9XVF5_9MYCO|nr:cell wall synthesis protein CwsA [Mycobacterium botniense]